MSFCATCQCPVMQQRMHHSFPTTKMRVWMPLMTIEAPLCHLRRPICIRCKIGMLASEDKPKPNSEINVFLPLSDSHLSLTHNPLAFPWSRTNIGIWNFTLLPATEQWCSCNAKTGSWLQPPLPWSKTFASLLACVGDRCIAQPCMSRLHTPSVHRLSTSRHSRDLHAPAPLLMSELIIRCTGPVRQCFIYPPSADVKIMIH